MKQDRIVVRTSPSLAFMLMPFARNHTNAFSYNERKLVKSKGWTILHFFKINITKYYQYVESIVKQFKHV